MNAGVLLTLLFQVESATIAASPRDTLIDAPVRIVVTGVPPGREIVIRSIGRADTANALVAWGRYVADARGAVQLDRDAATAGTYTGIDPMGLFWSAELVPLASIPNGDVPAGAVSPPDPYDVTITASIDDTVTVARTTVRRRFAAASVRIEEVRAGDVVGQLFLPATPPGRRAPLVIVLGGSEGGYESSAYRARLLAAHGFAALAQGYFRAPGLPDELASVPIERVQRAIAWARRRSDVATERIGVIGSSRGTELALLAANYNREVAAVVLFATSITTGSGLTREGAPRPEAAWTRNNSPLPALQHQPPPEALAQFSRPEPVRLRLLFEPALQNSAAIERAAIPLDALRADVLVVSGIDDQMGPADIAGDMLLERLARRGHRGRRVHLKYPEAGHVISIPYTAAILRLAPWRFAIGGNVRGYGRADADSWPRVLEFLRTSL
jgi:fermentation-respiration switch protein FrsA (DUF1100 family)